MALRVFFDLPAWIGVLGPETDPLGELEHRVQSRNRKVCVDWSMPEVVVQPRDLLSGHFRDALFTERRQDLSRKQASIFFRGRFLASRFNVFGKESFGEIGYGWSRPSFGFGASGILTLSNKA